MDQATWDLILRNLWPMLRATVTATIPLTTISFVLGLVLALFVALARISRINPAVPAGAGVRLGDPGDAAAGAAVHCLLRAAAVRDRHRPRSRRR
jgi:ABC-type amino acid transport system permease subunit